MIRTAPRTLGLACVLATCLIGGWPLRPAHSRPDAEVSPRRPVAVALLHRRLYVANRSGTISIVDPDALKVLGERAVGHELSDLRAGPGQASLWAVDSQLHQVLVLHAEASRVTVAQRIPVAAYPQSIAFAPDGSWAAVASLWSRRLTWINPSDATAAGLAVGPWQTSTLDLPFAAREQWVAPDGRHVVVADAYGGRLGVVDVRLRKLVAVRSIEGHNIRGLALAPNGTELLVSHQLLNQPTSTTHDNVFWGNLMANVVRSVPLAELWDDTTTVHGPHLPDAASRPISHWTMLPLGRPGAGTGDPGRVVVTRTGKTLVLLSGIGAVALSPAPQHPMEHRELGRRPVSVVLTADEALAYVASQFSESVAVFDMNRIQVNAEIPLGPSASLSLADRGEQLFYDARLSLDGWYSCHSCHTDGHSSGLLNDNFSDGSFGAPKRILSLLGTAGTGPWAWNGSQSALGSQIHKSLEITMQGDPTQDRAAIQSAIAAYLETLEPPPGIDVARGIVDRQRVEAGRRVFEQRHCVDCHTPPAYTSPDVYDVELPDELGQRAFNPPSLRGVSQRDHWFHDDRAATLSEVFTRFRHPHGEPTPADEIEPLLAFLRSL